MSFFGELKRRNVVRVGIAYVVIGWALAQVAEFAVDNFGAPDRALQIFVVFLLLGLPLVLVMAWTFEVTPEGVKHEKDIDRSRSIVAQPGRKLDFLVMGVLVVAVGFLLADKLFLADSLAPSDGAVTTERQSIAVLPFVNMSDDSDHFADGLSEELMNLLVKNRELKVTGRTSSFAFKGKNEDLRVIGNALNVGHVLEGSVRRSGDRLRITAQLIKVEDGFHLWSETYERKMADIFDIQDDVAKSITDALKLHLTLVSVRPTENAEAYALYLEAMAVPSGAGALERRLKLLDRAINLDPGFAKAYALKAENYWSLGTFALDGLTAQNLTYDAASKALKIDPSLARARAYAAITKPGNWSWIKEIEALDELIGAEPDNVRALGLLQWDLISNGYFDEALHYSERIIDLEPLAASAYAGRAGALLATGRREEARANWSTGVDFGGTLGLWWLGGDSLVNGDVEASIGWFEKFHESWGAGPTNVRSFVDNARDGDTGRSFLDRRVEDAIASASNQIERIRPYYWYLFFGYLDRYWEAIDALNDADGFLSNDLQLRYAGMVFSNYGFMRHPRYRQDAVTEGTIELWEKRGPPDRCSKVNNEWKCE